MGAPPAEVVDVFTGTFEPTVTPEEREKALARRQQIVAEFAATERSYVTQLRALDELYITPLLKEASKPDPILPLKMCDVIFHNIRR